MKIKIAIIAVALAGMSLAGLGSASAFQESDVAVAYADGYMGNDQQFHEWEHRSDAQEFRTKHPDQYRAWRHDDPRHHDSH
jgi:hypothetical protein